MLLKIEIYRDGNERFSKEYVTVYEDKHGQKYARTFYNIQLLLEFIGKECGTPGSFIED